MPINSGQYDLGETNPTSTSAERAMWIRTLKEYQGITVKTEAQEQELRSKRVNFLKRLLRPVFGRRRAG